MKIVVEEFVVTYAIMPLLTKEVKIKKTFILYPRRLVHMFEVKIAPSNQVVP